MNLDKKDRAILEATALVGYCQSIQGMILDTKSANQWFDRLVHYVTRAQIAIDEAMSDKSNDGKSDD